MRRTASSWRCAVGFGLWVAACGGEENPPATVPTNRPDAGDAGEQSGSEPYDGSVPLPRRDAGTSTIPPGDPAKGLTGPCSVDSNKIYTVAERDRPFSSTPLAADHNNSRFIMPFVATGDCLDSVHMSMLMGAANGGEPTDSPAIDTCALVREAAAAALSDRWLLATTDNREAPYDVWLTPYNPKTGDVGDSPRVRRRAWRRRWRWPR